MSDENALAEILETVKDIKQKIDATAAAVAKVESEVGPLISSLSESPIFRMLGGKKS